MQLLDVKGPCDSACAEPPCKADLRSFKQKASTTQAVTPVAMPGGAAQPRVHQILCSTTITM